MFNNFIAFYTAGANFLLHSFQLFLAYSSAVSFLALFSRCSKCPPPHSIHAAARFLTLATARLISSESRLSQKSSTISLSSSKVGPGGEVQLDGNLTDR